MSLDNQKPPSDEDVKHWINRRGDSFDNNFNAIRDVSAKVGDEALRFVGLAQLGGIAGCLGFIGALKHGSSPIIYAIVAYVIGVVFLLLSHLFRYQSLVNSGRFVMRQAAEFARKPTVEVSQRLDGEAEARDAAFFDWSAHAAIASALMFVIGCGFAIMGALQVRDLPSGPSPTALTGTLDAAKAAAHALRPRPGPISDPLQPPPQSAPGVLKEANDADPQRK